MKYSSLVDVYEKISGTSKRLEKTWYIAQFLKRVKKKDLKKTLLLLQGRVFARHAETKIGFATSYVMKSINVATGIALSKIENKWRDTGDLGKVAQLFCKKKTQATLFSKDLSVDKVFDNIVKLASIEGAGTVNTKVKIIAELLTNATPTEAKYIVRSVLDEMRVGVGEGSMRDALMWAYLPAVIGVFKVCAKCKLAVPEAKKCIECGGELEKEGKLPKTLSVQSLDDFKLVKHDIHKFDHIQVNDDKDGKKAREIYNFLADQVQHAYDLTNDFGEVAEALSSQNLETVLGFKLEPGRPLKVMLAIKENTVAQAFERVGRPAAIEFKLDGFRLQIHKNFDSIKLFTRRLEEVTKQFPEVVEYAKKYIEGDSFILDAEAVGFDAKTGKFLPFQRISQRIKRKYDIHQLAKDLPVQVNVFDILCYEGEELLQKPFKERRALLEKIVKEKKQKLLLVEHIKTDDDEKAERFYQKALKAGEEGVMFKALDAPYKPGARVGHMVKLKSVMETLDLVIVGGEWGEGKRSSWISSFLVACRDEEGNLLEVGRVATGLKEKDEEGLSFNQMTKRLRPLIIKEKGREITIKPRLVIEVAYEEIQKSPKYSSEYALRFPRIVRDRSDERDEKNCSSLKDVKRLFVQQRK